MIISKQAQENLLTEYIGANRTASELTAFTDGMNAMMSLVDKIEKERGVYAVG